MPVLIALLAAVGAADVLTPAGLTAVEVGGEIGRRIDVTIDNNLLVVDLENDFLQPFLERNRDGGYIGLGKTIDAMARFCAYSQNKKLIARKKKVVDALLDSQEAGGYLGMFKKESRTTSLWDVHELSYLVLGLTADYEFCGETRSLDAARNLADYLMGELNAGKQVGAGDLNPNMGTTGLDEAFLYLSEQTGDGRYRRFVVEQRDLPGWRFPITLGRWGMIDGHAYAYMAECLAQVRLTEQVDDPGLWHETNKVFDFLLNRDGLVITGTCGDHECWHDTQSGTTNLGETCATAYLVRLCAEVLEKTGDPSYGDLMERSIFNALFAAQSPDGRRIRYYSPFEAPRVYFDGDTYCCPCNYRRIVAELPTMIYYGRGDGVYVNLYAPSHATVAFGEGRKIVLRQDTDYPSSGKVEFAIEETDGEPFRLYLRRPGWAENATVRVNGESVQPETPGAGLLAVNRRWKAGDTLQAEFPMDWRLVKGRKAQSGRVAVMRGPMVFTYNPKLNPEVKGDPRLFTLDGEAEIEGPIPSDGVRPGGIACKVQIWEPGVWYPHAKSRPITLTEFPDPDATWTYFTTAKPR